MKKMNLKDFKNGLKREEMRNISGGIAVAGDNCGKFKVCQDWEICCTVNYVNYYCQSSACTL